MTDETICNGEGSSKASHADEINNNINENEDHQQDLRPRQRGISTQQLISERETVNKWHSEALKQLDMETEEEYQGLVLEALPLRESSSAKLERRFDKACFAKFQVLGQVDNKFIGCLFADSEKNPTSGMINIGNCKKVQGPDTMLVLVDQHAAHERVRLEHLEDTFFPSSDKFGRIAKTTKLETPLPFHLADFDVDLAENHNSGLMVWGIQLERIGDDDLVITHLPSAVVETLSNGTQKLLVNRTTIDELIQTEIFHLVETHGSRRWSLPPTLQDILNTRACHGAIRFGDALTLNTCNKLLQQLSQCKLPFQCARKTIFVSPFPCLHSVSIQCSQPPRRRQGKYLLKTQRYCAQNIYQRWKVVVDFNFTATTSNKTTNKTAVSLHLTATTKA
eukprot:m.204038 g.204038  ORF g.204038 m.204038 type:complete len:393 (-) comp13739_c1_seq4:1027-2205(-)